MAEKILFKGATIIDGSGNAPVKGSLIIQGKDILEIGANVTCEDAKVVDLSGKYVMPGIINAHAHILFDGDSPNSTGQLEKDTPAMAALRATKNLKKMLRSGVTFFRDMGGREHIDVDLRNARNQGIVEGPEFHVSGRVITMTGGHIWMFGRQCDGPDEVRKAAREQLKAGVDLIKIVATGGVLSPGMEPGAPQLNYDEIAAAVEEAQKAGKKSATHANGTAGITNAVKAGISSVEHGIFLTDELIELMINNGTYLVPTLMAPHCIFHGGLAAGIPDFAVKKTGQVIETHVASFKKAYEAGVKIAMGPDTGTPLNRAGDSALEIKLLVDNGMSPMDGILSATRNAADLLGISGRYGTLEKGKAADFLILGGDPLADIGAIQSSLEQVYKLGKLVD